MIHAFEMMSIGYFSVVEKTKTILHYPKGNVSNVFHFPAITRKLRYLDGMKGIISPYHKPQRLIKELLELFIIKMTGFVIFFVGIGTTIYALQNKRSCIAIEKNPLQVAFILHIVCAINDLPDADQEVDARYKVLCRECGSAVGL